LADSALSGGVRANQVSPCRWRDSAQSAQPTHGLLRSRSCGGLLVSLPCVCQCLASAALFFRLPYATSPARRIKKEPSRRSPPPEGPPRSPIRPLCVFDSPLTPCRSPHVIENRTPSRGGTHKDKLQ